MLRASQTRHTQTKLFVSKSSNSSPPKVCVVACMLPKNRGTIHPLLGVSKREGILEPERSLCWKCSCEQRHFYANKETEVHHFSLKLYKTRCTPVKRHRKLPAQKVQGMASSRTRSERDQNEERDTICIIWGIKGRDRVFYLAGEELGT